MLTFSTKHFLHTPSVNNHIDFGSSTSRANTMLIIGTLTVVAITVVIPILFGVVPISQIPDFISEGLTKFIYGNNEPRMLITPPPTPPAITGGHLEIDVRNTLANDTTAHDVLHDIESLVKENAVKIYNQYVPEPVANYVNTTYTYWQAHSSYKVYKDHESTVNSILLITGLALTLKLLWSVVILIVGLSSTSEAVIVEETLAADDKGIYMNNKYVTEFETMPICTGRGDSEELEMLKSYEENHVPLQTTILSMLEKNAFAAQHDEIGLLDGSTPRRTTPDVSSGSTSATRSELASPLTVKSKHLNGSTSISVNGHHSPSPISTSTPPVTGGSGSSTSSRSPSPEDSFEREERILDRSLSQLNKEKSERPYTPSKLSNSLEYSPSKRLLYKKSSALILTNHQIPASETTVGEITEEVIYSEPFSSDDSGAVAPLRDKL